MTDPMSDVADLAALLVMVLEKSAGVPPLAVATVDRISFTAGQGEAQLLFGFTPGLVPVPSANWFTGFAQQVQTGNVTGRRVLAAFVATQPIILGTLGV